MNVEVCYHFAAGVLWGLHTILLRDRQTLSVTFSFCPLFLFAAEVLACFIFTVRILKTLLINRLHDFFVIFFMMSVCTINTTEHKYNTLTYKLDNIDKETIIKAFYYYYFFSLAWINDINPYIILGVSIILSKPCINIVKAGSYYKPVYFSLDTNA